MEISLGDVQHAIVAAFARLRTTILILLLVLLAGLNTGQAANQAARGSGVVIGDHGEVLTNAHVVKDCAQIAVVSPSGDSIAAQLIARDEDNDIAVISGSPSMSSTAAFRGSSPVRAGEAVVALGYPLIGLLAKAANLTVGNVSALAGIHDDARYLQISAPIQPGNSGGPLLDTGGHLIGIVTSKLNAALIATFTGDIPQNVNFALKAEVARTFLDSRGITYKVARSEQNLPVADIGDIARPFTVQIRCVPGKSRDQDAAAAKAPTISQQAILFVEDTSTPRGKAYYGLTTWRTQLTPSTDAKTGSETVVVAQAAIPEPRMLASWILRRNTDRSLAASHVIEISINLPRNTPGGGINNVPGVLMKVSQTTQGIPLTGPIEKVKGSSFLIRLSSGETEMQQNLQLLRDREWIDIALVYNDGKRGILALEKGRSGERAFAEAFAEWKQ